MMMMEKNKNNHEGYIPLFRRFLDNELWTEKRKFSRAEAWIDLLFMARYAKEPEEIIDRGEVITIGYGEILTSIKSLAERWGRSRTWVRALLEHLTSKCSIKYIRKDRRRTIIKVVKLGYFQELVGKKTSEKVTERHKKDIRKTHNNKDNKDNKDKVIPQKELVAKQKKYSSLKDIGEEEFRQVADFYNVPLPFVRSCYDDLVNYCGAHGKRYKNYLMALRNFVKNDALKIRKEVNERVSKRGIDARDVK